MQESMSAARTRWELRILGEGAQAAALYCQWYLTRALEAAFRNSDLKSAHVQDFLLSVLACALTAGPNSPLV